MSIVLRPVVAVAATTQQSAPSAHASNVTAVNDCGDQSILATALIPIYDHQGNPVTFRALCDPGSYINMTTLSLDMETSRMYHRKFAFKLHYVYSCSKMWVQEMDK